VEVGGRDYFCKDYKRTVLKENLITDTIPRGSNDNNKAHNYVLFLSSNRSGVTGKIHCKEHRISYKEQSRSGKQVISY